MERSRKWNLDRSERQSHPAAMWSSWQAPVFCGCERLLFFGERRAAPKQQLELTAAAISISREVKFLQAAPATEPYR
jgi:hypothetical protein